jgi:hypothetical protein
MAAYDISSYQGLSQAISDYTENTDPSFLAYIPTFIQDTERLVNNSVQLPAFRKNVTGTATSGFPYLTLPNDFLATFSVAVINNDAQSTYEYMLNKDVNYIREAFPYPGVTGQPQYYAIFDASTYILGPTPDQNYTIELHYFAYPESIVTAGATWLSQNYPNVLLWGSLCEANTYNKGEQDLQQTYQNLFDEAMKPLIALGDGRDRQDNYRTTQVRHEVTQ